MPGVGCLSPEHRPGRSSDVDRALDQADVVAVGVRDDRPPAGVCDGGLGRDHRAAALLSQRERLLDRVHLSNDVRDHRGLHHYAGLHYFGRPVYVGAFRGQAFIYRHRSRTSRQRK